MERQVKAPDKLEPVIARRDWLTTAQVAEAAGVHQSTLGRWRRRGLLPEPVFVSLGKRGRSQRWPPQTAAQAAWIKAQLEAGHTFEEITACLARDGFKTSLEVDSADSDTSQGP